MVKSTELHVLSPTLQGCLWGDVNSELGVGEAKLVETAVEVAKRGLFKPQALEGHHLGLGREERAGHRPRGGAVVHQLHHLGRLYNSGERYPGFLIE